MSITATIARAERSRKVLAEKVTNARDTDRFLYTPQPFSNRADNDK